LDELIQRTLANIREPTFTLSIYFGLNTQHKYNPLALRLFDLFQAPLLRAVFEKQSNWQLQSVRTIGANDIPNDHHEFVVEAATKYFTGRNRRVRRRTAPRYDVAILHDPHETEAPSNPKAMQKFAKAAEAVGLNAEFITRDDFGRLAEFDALFIRETTRVNHHTFRFARRAAAEGLIVIDDPDSILRCTNKVYLAELLTRRGVPVPKTLLVHRDNVDEIVDILGLPVVLKQPDSSFSQGVVKIESQVELVPAVSKLLDKSDLIVAQEYLPTTFDWRVGICDRRPLYVCKYFMAQRHWQIIKRDEAGRPSGEGNVETLSVGETPREVINTALKAADLIGDGLYGVDLKQLGERCYVIEINDNPSIDAGFEDSILKDALYREIMGVFLKRIEEAKRGHITHE
jgi:glutathione synthase/RimK-type ligase-like ATP-grasp enzyme